MIDIRRWLRREPRPARLRVDGRDVAMAVGPSVWKETEATILALNPSKVEALSEIGVVLRVLDFERGDSAEDERQEDGATASGDQLERIARIIADAHDAGARRHEAAYALAFTELVKLVNILAARLGGLETAWQKAMNVLAKAQMDAASAAAAGGGDAMEEAMGGLLARALMNDVPGAATAAAKPNGKATGNGKAQA